MNVSLGLHRAINPETGKKDKNGVCVTKNGNTYYRTNMGKKVGLGVAAFGAGLIGGAVAMGTRNAALASGVAKKAANMFGLKMGLLQSGITAAKTLPGLLIGGAIVDAAVNTNERKKADAMAPYSA